MKIETILNAMLGASSRAAAIEAKTDYESFVAAYKKRLRQYFAFRSRILREFAIYRNYSEANGFDREQAWFWTDEWQAGEREVDDHIARGEIESFDSMTEFLETLETT